jgi:hypothetical protein
VRLFLFAPKRLPLRVSVDGRLHSRLAVGKLEEVRIGLSGPSWHLIALDAARLPEIRGKPRGARIVAYALP